MEMRKYVFLVGVLFSCICLSAQHEGETTAENPEHEPTHEALEHTYKIALTFGYSHIPAGFEEGQEEVAVFVPSVGVDFFYSLGHKFDLGMVVDWELAEYLVEFNRESLTRERALILALVGAYEVIPHWKILAGGGIEWEKHRNLAVVRVGTEYEIELNKGWDLGPSLFFDIKEAFSVWGFHVALGKRF